MEIINTINNMESPTMSGLFICAIFLAAFALMAVTEVIINKVRK